MNHLFQDLSDATQGSYRLWWSPSISPWISPSEAQISDSLTEKVSTFSEQVSQNLARVEASLDKILEAKAESGRKARADRGWQRPWWPPLWLMLSGGMWENTRWKLFEASFAAPVELHRIHEFFCGLNMFERLRGCYLPRSGQQRFLPAELRNSLRWRGTVFGRLWCFTWIAFQTGYGSLKGQWIVRS